MTENLVGKPIKSAVIVSKVYKRPVSGAIYEIASLLKKLGVEAYLDQNTSVGFNIPDIPCLSRKAIKEKVQIPIKPDGSFDLEKQRDLAQKFATIEGIKENIRNQIEALTNIVVI